MGKRRWRQPAHAATLLRALLPEARTRAGCDWRYTRSVHRRCGPGFVIVRTFTENFPGLHDIPTVLGPLARSVEDIELACRVAFGQESADTAPIPYREVTLPQKLRFGYYVSGALLGDPHVFALTM